MQKHHRLCRFVGNIVTHTLSSRTLYQDLFGEQERRRQKARTLKVVLASAWKTIVYIDLLDKTEEFKNRYQPNRKTLHSIIDGLKGFDYPDENYIIKGCAHGISADSRFFWCDSEHFAACSSKSSYQSYLQKFPSGNHVEEANKRIEEIKARDKKILKYVLIAAAIIILAIIIVCSANAKSHTHNSSSSRPHRTENVYSGYNSYDSEESEEESSYYESVDEDYEEDDEDSYSDDSNDYYEDSDDEFEEDYDYEY